MNSITVSYGTVTEIKQFHARGETGVDVYIRDESSYGTVFFQVVYYGKKAESVLRNLQVNDQVNIAGTITVNSYRKKDGTTTAILVIRNPGSMFVHNRNLLVPPRDENISDPVKSPDWDDDYPFY